LDDDHYTTVNDIFLVRHSRTGGVATIVTTYILLQLERVRSEQLIISMLNAVGAALILISLTTALISIFIVEFFWLLISLFGSVSLTSGDNKLSSG
jgi:hypothetical protein